MQPKSPEHTGHGDQLAVTGPAVEIHGRAVTATRRAAEWYREAQRAADTRGATAALRLAVSADPGFGLAAADLAAITGAPDPGPGRGPMTWERHHIASASSPGSGRPCRRTASKISLASFPGVTPPDGRARILLGALVYRSLFFAATAVLRTVANAVHATSGTASAAAAGSTWRARTA